MILNRSIEGWGRFWKRIGSKPNFKDKTVVGYGCGHGCDTLEILRAGAKKVIALDIVPERLQNSYDLCLLHGYSNVEFVENKHPSELTA